MKSTNARFRGGRWPVNTRSDSPISLYSKCDQSPRFRLNGRFTGVSAGFMIILSTLVSTLYLRAIQDSFKTVKITGDLSMTEWHTHGEGSIKIVPSATPPCDWACYIENYEDLQYMKDSETARSHYIRHGMAEGRDCTCKHLPENCNWKCYLDNYEDLRYLSQTEQVAIDHYMNYGKAEERDCTCPAEFRPKTANDTAAICVIASEEEMYIDEWLDFHLGIGFGHIYIYDNSDNFDLGHGWLARRPRLSGKVTVEHFPGNGKQMPAYKHCLSSHIRPEGHGWVTFLDVDEFLVLKKHANVIEFLLDHCKQGSVSLNWQLFGWDRRLKFSPEPVTMRFQGQVIASENQHVKTISNVDAIMPGEPNNPHFVLLVGEQKQLDTDGNIVVDMWSNKAGPTDVASIHHYHTKSHKEYIDKRSRGRSDMSGDELLSTVAKNIAAAKRGDGLLASDYYNSSAWTSLQSYNDKYKIFGSLFRHDVENVSALETATSPIAICGIVTSQEAYIDEWVNFHVALGISSIFLFDSSQEFWMQEWSEERFMTSPVEVIHLPGNASDPFFVASTYFACLQNQQHQDKIFALMGTNDFLMSSPVLRAKQRNVGPNCIPKVRHLLFGNAGQYVYDPLPVTKRFQLRVKDDVSTNSIPPVLLVSSDVTERHLLESLKPGSSSEHCEFESTDLTAYHYIRSRKECRQQRGDVELCNLTGDVMDTSGWDQMLKLVPGYSGYNDFL